MRNESYPSWSRADASMQGFGTSHWRSTGCKLMRLPDAACRRDKAPVLMICVVEASVAVVADVLGGAIATRSAGDRVRARWSDRSAATRPAMRGADQTSRVCFDRKQP